MQTGEPISAALRIGVPREIFSGEKRVATVPDVVEKLIKTYIDLRHEDEHFLDTAKRIGIEPFKARVYDKKAGHAEVASV